MPIEERKAGRRGRIVVGKVEKSEVHPTQTKKQRLPAFWTPYAHGGSFSRKNCSYQTLGQIFISRAVGGAVGGTPKSLICVRFMFQSSLFIDDEARPKEMPIEDRKVGSRGKFVVGKAEKRLVHPTSTKKQRLSVFPTPFARGGCFSRKKQ